MELALWILLFAIGLYLFARGMIKQRHAMHDEEMRILRQIRDEK